MGTSLSGRRSQERRKARAARENQRPGPVRHVCGAHRGGGLFEGSRAGGALYLTILIYHAGRPAAGPQTGGSGSGGLRDSGAGGPTHLCPRRGDRLRVPAQLWLPHRLCPGGLGHRDPGPAREGPAGNGPPAGGQLRRAGGGVSVRHGLLLGGDQLLPGYPPGPVASAAVLPDPGGARGPFLVRGGGHGGQTAAAAGGKRKEREK